MAAYYNEIDPYAAQWLRNLIQAGHIAPGDVDERSIADVRSDDLRGYDQCHFFAGIGGWSLALRLAGWPDNRPVWTGSCPCQSYSSAANGRSRGRYDLRRHLWPTWWRLIFESNPRTIFGEQVAQVGHWFDEVCNDLENMGYAIGASILPACSVGQDHVRYRLYFVGDSDFYGQSGKSRDAKEASGMPKYIGQSGIVEAKNGVPPRMGRLRAYGNAIVPQVAAQFIEAFRLTEV